MHNFKELNIWNEANELDFIDNEMFKELNLKLRSIQKMLVKFQKHLNNN